MVAQQGDEHTKRAPREGFVPEGQSKYREPRVARSVIFWDDYTRLFEACYWVGCFVSAFCIAIAWHWEWGQRAGNALRAGEQDE